MLDKPSITFFLPDYPQSAPVSSCLGPLMVLESVVLLLQVRSHFLRMIHGVEAVY